MRARRADEIIPPDGKRVNINIKKIPVSKIFLGILILIFLKTTLYTIQTNEIGVVLRLGRIVRESSPGLHIKLPFGIEKVIPVKVEYVYKEEFGFRTRTPGIRTSYVDKNFQDESLMLTGDLNVLDIEWIVQYKIKSAASFLFKIRNPIKTLRDISESAMRRIIGDYTFDEVLTTKRIEINNLAQKHMQEILDSYDSGIQIITVKLQDVNPPDPVKPAFNEVNEAKQEREKMINQAWEVYNKKIPQAKGEAEKMIREAEGYAAERVNKAEGEAERFNLLRREYVKAKQVTKRRLYLETMEKIIKKAGKKYVIDPEEKSILPLLQLEKNGKK